MVYIGSEAKWRLYCEGGVKKILALAGAKGRHKNMFSAVMSTSARQLGRVKENAAKEISRNVKSRPVLIHSSVPYLRIISLFYTDNISAAVYSITVMCVGSCAYPLHL